MTKRGGALSWAVMTTVLLAACGAPADKLPTGSAGAGSTESIAEPPSADALLALERRANEAYLDGNRAFFEGLLSDRFVMLAPGGGRMDKAAVTAMIAGVRCEVKDGWVLDEPRLSKVDADTFVFSYRGTFDGFCALDGRTEKLPSPVRGATVWVRRGGTWRAAFHGKNPIFDPRTAEAPPDATAGGSDASSAEDDTGHDPESATRAADPTTEAMVAVETAIWNAWKDRDAEIMEELTADDLAFIDIFGNVTSGKAETIAFWTEHECDVRGVRVADGTRTALSETVGILTFKGLLEGTCGGQEFPLIHGTSVYVKDGDSWKSAFTLNSLAR